MINARHFSLGMMVVPMVLLGLAVAIASSVTTPNTFVAGTPALAAQVNANFAAHAAAINDNFAGLPQVFAQRDADFGGTTELATGQKEMNSINVNLPTAGYLVISGGVFINNNEAAAQAYTMHALLDAAPIGPTASIGVAYMTASAAADQPELFSLNYTVTTAVTAGAHTVSQTAGPSSGTANFFHNGEYFTVQFIPTGSVASVNSP